MSDYSLAVIGTHEYAWALKPFMTMFRKYWGCEPIVYVGDRDSGGLPEDLAFQRVPAYAEGVWPWEHWFGNGLVSFLQTVQTPLLVLFFPDQWLTSPVYHTGVQILAAYMLAHPEVVRGNLTAETGYEVHGQVIEEGQGYLMKSIDPADIHAGYDGGITFCPSLWRPDLLAGLLEPHWDLWACERLGTQKLRDKRRDVHVVGILPAPVHRIHVLSHHTTRRVSLIGMRAEDQVAIQGLLPDGWEVLR